MSTKLTATGVEFPDATTQTTSGLLLTGGTMTGTIAGFTSTGIDDNATSTSITIDASENVGIGTATPGNTLEVFKSTGFNTAWTAPQLLHVHSTTNIAGISMKTDAGVNWSIASDDGSKLRIHGNGTERLQLTNDGRGLSQFTAHAWVNLNQTGTQAIRDSHNISSISDQGTGVTRMNYSNNLGNSSTDSCTVATGKAGAFISLSTDSAGYWEGESRNANDSNEDTATFTAVVFGG